jgi:hypothetical protein
MSVPEIIRRAIEIGERNGQITFDELNELWDKREILQPKHIERILNALSQEGIRPEE